jgi:signal transduction histidine kinase
MNLLNNASKFSKEETTIHLTVRNEDDEILVSVQDTGIGIKEDDLERVFTPLAMIEKPIYVKGTGLGLSISKGIIDLHNGKIWAESEGEWKGAKFTIQLPKGGEK